MQLRGTAQNVEPSLRLQALDDALPAAVHRGANLAFAILRAAAGAVDEAFGTLGHGTDAAGLAQNAVAAEVARLFPDAESDGFAEVHGVVGRIGGDAGGIFLPLPY